MSPNIVEGCSRSLMRVLDMQFDNLNQAKFKLDLPSRTRKPRENGLSNLVDNGYGLAALDDTLQLCHPFVDIVKLGWASAYITATLSKKVEMFGHYNIRTCLGGMMFEICWWQNKIDDYAAWIGDLGIDMVEISNGSLAMPERDKRQMIEYFAKKGFTVLAEVGSKDITHVSPPAEWVEFTRADLDAGAWKVILEGRADASAGVYRKDGSLQDVIIETILDAVPAEKLIFEAPHKPQMTWFIKRLGSDVNIGNVPLGEVLNLETLRQGLRGDTVRHFQEGKRC
jgi:phosphosulfolactate synthase